MNTLKTGSCGTTFISHLTFALPSSHPDVGGWVSVERAGHFLEALREPQQLPRREVTASRRDTPHTDHMPLDLPPLSQTPNAHGHATAL